MRFSRLHILFLLFQDRINICKTAAATQRTACVTQTLLDHVCRVTAVAALLVNSSTLKKRLRTMKTTSVCWPIKPERWDILMVNTMKDKTFLHERHSRLASFFVTSIEFFSFSIDKDRCFQNEGRRIYGFSMAVERKSFLLFSFYRCHWVGYLCASKLPVV